MTQRQVGAESAEKQPNLAVRRDQHEAFPRFLYLQTDSARRIVKAGCSRNPDKRLASYVVGCTLGRRTYKWDSYRVVWVQPLGIVTRRAAFAIERQLHFRLQDVAYAYDGEWYRMPASRAIAIARRFLRDFEPQLHPLAPLRRKKAH